MVEMELTDLKTVMKYLFSRPYYRVRDFFRKENEHLEKYTHHIDWFAKKLIDKGVKFVELSPYVEITRSSPLQPGVDCSIHTFCGIEMRGRTKDGKSVTMNMSFRYLENVSEMVSEWSRVLRYKYHLWVSVKDLECTEI